MTNKSYRELRRLETFEERYLYLRLTNVVGESTFGFDRALNQMFYHSKEWRHIRDEVIVRDNGCDLGILDRIIHSHILIHHMNPIDIHDIEETRQNLLDPEFLICTTFNTHRAIHFGDESLLIKLPIARRPNDTIPWR